MSAWWFLVKALMGFVDREMFHLHEDWFCVLGGAENSYDCVISFSKREWRIDDKAGYQQNDCGYMYIGRKSRQTYVLFLKSYKIQSYNSTVCSHPGGISELTILFFLEIKQMNWGGAFLILVMLCFIVMFVECFVKRSRSEPLKIITCFLRRPYDFPYDFP